MAFLGTECPLALQYAPRLVELSERFADARRGVHRHQREPAGFDHANWPQYAKTHDIKFPLLKDVGNHVADQLGAERTPEVFVLDRQRIVRYRGRIDDQYLVGRQRKAATREDLALAIEELLAGKPVSQSVTEAPGCRIGRVHKANPARCRHLHQAHRPAARTPLRRVPPRGRDRPLRADQLRRRRPAGPRRCWKSCNDNRMPPWHANPEYGHFSNDRRLSDEEKQLLASGSKPARRRAIPRTCPRRRKFAEGWRLPRVDQEIFMSKRAVRRAGRGHGRLQVLRRRSRLHGGQMGARGRVQAGNRGRGAPHHLVGSRRGAARQEQPRRRLRARASSTATAPGAHPLLLADGMAKRVPAGSKLVFQMHYTPNGSPQKDRSSVGLMFADRRPGPQGSQHDWRSKRTCCSFRRARPTIELDAWHTFRHDTLLLSLFPHMHLRGKSFRYEAQYPDGTKEILLDVPRYDFAWQQTYELAEPKLIAQGHQDALHRPLRQLGRQRRQSESQRHRPLGRTNLG